MRLALLPTLLLLACNTGSGDENKEPQAILTYPDEDKDSIPDMDEGYVDPAEGKSVDTDGDGTPDYQDQDSDDDGIPDKSEAGDDDAATLPWDSDVDGVADYRDTDSDGNCIADSEEGLEDPDEDGIENYHDLDDEFFNAVDAPRPDDDDYEEDEDE